MEKDTDGDGIPDHLDDDDDGDGIPDHLDKDDDGDGIPDDQEDADGDGIPDHLGRSTISAFGLELWYPLKSVYFSLLFASNLYFDLHSFSCFSVEFELGIWVLGGCEHLQQLHK